MNGMGPGDSPEEVSRAEFAELNTDAPTTGSAPWVRQNYGLVKNLKVGVSAMLGGCEITVDELFSLKEGSTVNLDQPVDALVDMAVEGKVVARGEIVVVGDNFGIRVVELLAPDAGSGE